MRLLPKKNLPLITSKLFKLLMTPDQELSIQPLSSSSKLWRPPSSRLLSSKQLPREQLLLMRFLPVWIPRSTLKQRPRPKPKLRLRCKRKVNLLLMPPLLTLKFRPRLMLMPKPKLRPKLRPKLPLLLKLSRLLLNPRLELTFRSEAPRT